MATNEQLTQQVNALTERLNNLENNSETINQQNLQTPLSGTSEFAIEDGGVNYKATIQQLLDAAKDNDYCEFHIPTPPQVIALDNDGITYTKVPNMTLKVGDGFSVTGGTLKKENKGGVFLINGVSDLEVNKAVSITYALFVNGVEAPGESTPHTFTSQSKIENISITSIADISEGDEIDIRVKGDGIAINVNATIRKLDVTFLQVDD